MRRLLAPLAALLVTVGGLAGCGVPSGSGVVVEGRGEDAAPVTDDDRTSEPAGRTATTDPARFVLNYLAAAAGDPDEAEDRAREFFAPEARDGWSPAGQVEIVRVHGEPETSQDDNTGYEVRLIATVLGVLEDDGIFAPRPPVRRAFSFGIARNTVEGRTGLHLTRAEPRILLSDEALGTYFERRTIYFWSAGDQKVLVPDLRYLPRRDVPYAQRPTMIIDWLLGGPSPWLRRAVDRLPDAARQVGKVPAPDNGVLRVELSKAANIDDEAQVARLAAQLRWSLRTDATHPTLELGIDQLQRSFSGTDYLKANPAHRDGGQPRLRFALVQGRVRQLGAPTETTAVPVVPTASNGQVVRAALAVRGDRTLVALLRRLRNGQVALEVGSVADPADRLRRTGLRAPSVDAVTQPAWLPGSPGTGLVVIDGELHSFRASDGQVAGVLHVPVPGGITAFAVPPDGRRLAYIAGGELFVAPLIPGGRRLDVAPQEEHLRVPTTLTGLTGVAWSQQDWLAVAGERAPQQNGIEDITVDGAVREPPRGETHGTQPVENLVASTDDPANGPGAGQVLYVVAEIAYEAFAEWGELSSADVAGADVPPNVVPTYPFYVE